MDESFVRSAEPFLGEEVKKEGKSSLHEIPWHQLKCQAGSPVKHRQNHNPFIMNRQQKWRNLRECPSFSCSGLTYTNRHLGVTGLGDAALAPH